MRETLQQRRGRAAEILARIRRAHPGARCELDWSTPLELAIAAILSAQCTDRRVNLVTPALFAKYRSAADLAAVSPETLEGEIRSTGFFRNKARHIRELARALLELHAGALPERFDALVALPGIGRKTANLLIVTAFGRPGLIVDTHCTRVSGRLGLTSRTDATKIEMDLRELLPEADWGDFSHAIVFHGRYTCLARKPDCARCPLPDLCPYVRRLAKEQP